MLAPSHPIGLRLNPCLPLGCYLESVPLLILNLHTLVLFPALTLKCDYSVCLLAFCLYVTPEYKYKWRGQVSPDFSVSLEPSTIPAQRKHSINFGRMNEKMNKTVHLLHMYFILIIKPIKTRKLIWLMVPVSAPSSVHCRHSVYIRDDGDDDSTVTTHILAQCCLRRTQTHHWL